MDYYYIDHSHFLTTLTNDHSHLLEATVAQKTALMFGCFGKINMV